MKTFLLSVAQGLYRLLPLGRETRLNLKRRFFTALAPLIHDTPAYRNWNSSERKSLAGSVGSLSAGPGVQPRHRDAPGTLHREVTVVVPSYNYARYIEQRLQSILSQTYPLTELIVLDDASTDDSVNIIKRCLDNSPIDARVIINDANSGSVFEQWRKGAELASGDFIWICEADDYADPTFLDRVIPLFDDPAVVLGYTQSRMIDEQGCLLENDYLDVTDDIDTRKWTKDYVCDGAEELASAMAVKNTIPNASAVVFRKSALNAALDECSRELQNLKVAGDWLIYSHILKQGRIGYIAESLNSHRKHSMSVSIASSNTRQMAEIIYMQRKIAGLVPVQKRSARKAHAYAKSAYSFLGIQPADFNEPAIHPEVSKWLKQLADVSTSGGRVL